MTEQILAWSGLALCLVLCLPIAGTRKLLLELTALALRVAILCAVAGGAYLYFFPERLPAPIATMAEGWTWWPAGWPTAGEPAFGLVLAAAAVAPLLPILAAFDVTRKLAGRRTRSLMEVADAPIPMATPIPVEVSPLVVPTAQVAAPPVVVRRTDRRAAAATLAKVSARKPFRVADHVS